MIELSKMKAVVLKDILQFRRGLYVAAVFGAFFLILVILIVSDDGGSVDDPWEDSIFEEEELLGPLFLASSFIFPMAFPNFFHKEVEDKTLKSLATYSTSFHAIKIYKLVSFMVYSAMVLTIVVGLPYLMALIGMGVFRATLEVVMLMGFMVLAMGALGYLCLTINDVVVTFYKKRVYFAHIAFALLVFFFIFSTEWGLYFLEEISGGGSYSLYSHDKSWIYKVLPTLSLYHVVARTGYCISFGWWRGLDLYVWGGIMAMMVGLSHYLKSRHNFDDWF